MNYLLSAIFGIAGIACFIWYKQIYRAYAEFMSKRFHEEFDGLAQKMGWDDPKNSTQLLLYKGSFTLGILFLAMAVTLLSVQFILGDKGGLKGCRNSTR